MTAPHSYSIRTAEAISRRFSILLERIAPSERALIAAKRRISGIADCIGNRFEVARALPVGSFYKGTAVKWHSDADFFVSLSRDEVRWGNGYKLSGTVLNNIGQVLREHYPATDVRRDGVGITVRFDRGSAPVDVVPAMYREHHRGLRSPIYLIPDGRNGWMDTAPDAQRAALAEGNRSSAGKLTRVLQLMKWWARCRETPVPLVSYHLEALLISEGLVSGVGRYSHLLYDVFGRLLRRCGAAVRDPLGVSGLIPVANTEARIDSFLRSVETAAMRAEQAVCAEQSGDLVEAARYWQMLLPDFPS